MPSARLLVLLSSDPHGPVVRHRWRLFQGALAQAGIVLEVVAWPKEAEGRRHAFHRAETADGVVVSSRLLRVRDTRRLRRRVQRLAFDVDDALWLRDSARGATASRTRGWRWRGLLGAADRVFAGNEYVAVYARRYGVEVDVLPTVVAVPAGEAPATPAVPPVVLGWIGSRATLPYLEAMGAGLKGIDGCLRVIADAVPRMPPGVEVEAVPWTEDGWRRALGGIHIGLAPLPEDAWTLGKCGLKILQMMSVGRPVVASPVGVQAKQVVSGETGVLAATVPEFHAAVRRLVDDPAERARLGHRALEVVRASWSAEVWAPRVVDAVERWLS